MKLMLKLTSTSRQVCRSFKRRRLFWKLRRQLYGPDHSARKSKVFRISNDKTQDINLESCWALRVTTLHIEHSTNNCITISWIAFSAVTFITCQTASTFLMSVSDTGQRDQASWLQSCSSTRSLSTDSIRRESIRFMMQRQNSMRALILHQNLKLRRRLLRRLQLSQKPSPVRFLEITELWTLTSSHTWLTNFNSSVVL